MKFPFDAAIFDLDGTLLDSLNVWKNIDREFFAARGMEVPADYGKALGGMSYRESAEYTIARFGLKETWQELVAIWMDMARRAYAEQVELMPGAREYLLRLKLCGVKLAAATALPEELYLPCLTHLGVRDLFDALCSTEDTDGCGKTGGGVFRLAAARLGVAENRCRVFEDMYEGIAGAKAAGMGAVYLTNGHPDPRAAAIADETAAEINDMLGDERCLIFTAHCEGDPAAAFDFRPDDCILCADAGWKTARALHLTPDAVIGDFDSGDAPAAGNVIRHPVEKDDTDTMLCIKYALEAGFRDLRIVGGLGGRLDHTLANLQAMAYAARRGARAQLSDGKTRVFMLHGDSARIPRTPGKLAVFAFGGVCEGVSIRGAKYGLEDALLTPDFPLGAGNDFAADFAEIGVKRGTLMIVCGAAPAQAE